MLQETEGVDFTWTALPTPFLLLSNNWFYEGTLEEVFTFVMLITKEQERESTPP